MAISVSTPKRLELPYRWNDSKGLVRVEMALNDDPVAIGVEDWACGFPLLRATIESTARGYREMIGWIQVVDRSDQPDGFSIDLFEPLGDVAHPFCLFGYSPVLFDSPHATYADWDFTAHTFLCGRGGKLLEQTEGGRRDVRAVLGFEWGFSKRRNRIDSFGPKQLSTEDWNQHLPYLHERFAEPQWTFLPGFFDHPLP